MIEYINNKKMTIDEGVKKWSYEKLEEVFGDNPRVIVADLAKQLDIKKPRKKAAPSVDIED